MKKYVFCLMAAASILAACNRENALNPQEAAISNAKSVKVYAGAPGTKTIISETGGAPETKLQSGKRCRI